MTHKTFFCIDAHTCGNPVRVVAGGQPILQGKDIREKRIRFIQEYDWIRKALMFEPRGHDMMSGSMIYPPDDPEHDAAILFIETSGCLPMCGHGTIGTVTVAIEQQLINPHKPGLLRLDTPAGLVEAYYHQEGKKVKSVKLINIPSFLYAEHIEVECPDLGLLSCDIAYGGNFYAIIDPQPHFPGMEHFRAEQLISWSRVVRERLNQQIQCVHPQDARIRGLTHVMWTGKPTLTHATARNAVFYGDKAIDRSPCGTGTSARMAQWHAKGKLKKGEPFIHESIIGSTFTGMIEAETTVGDKPAIVPSIEGWAKIYGYNIITVDEDDPFAFGFQVM
ncbi:MAG: 4-hydroxyproline epimerase [Thermoflavifilum sp.]|nr:4-hydroxyproline epimerase [Thermoflavifilum sp.]